MISGPWSVIRGFVTIRQRMRDYPLEFYAALQLLLRHLPSIALLDFNSAFGVQQAS